MIEPRVSVDGMAPHLGVTKESVNVWIAEKDVPAHRIGRLWRFEITEVDDWACSSRADGINGGH